MPTGNGIVIRIREEGSGTPEEVIRVSDAKQFRMVLWGRDGRLRVLGKAPWREMRRDVPSLLRDELRGKDILSIEAWLQVQFPSLTLESLDTVFRTMGREVKPLFQREWGKADGAFVFYITTAIVRAACWMKREYHRTRPLTKWEFPDSAVDKANANGILRWLFRGR